MTTVVRLNGVRRGFAEGGAKRGVLDGVDLEIEAGELVAIVGPTGAGKTTLLNVIGGLDGRFEGTASILGQDIRALDDDGRAQLRNASIGFVFQAFHLMEHLDVVENVQVPLWLGDADGDLRERAVEALGRVGLDDRASARVGALSGGERQRVAIARAIVNRPGLVLADEPTGNLDRDTGATIIALFDEVRRGDTAVVVVTHDPRVADRADRVLTLSQGKLQVDA